MRLMFFFTLVKPYFHLTASKPTHNYHCRAGATDHENKAYLVELQKFNRNNIIVIIVYYCLKLLKLFVSAPSNMECEENSTLKGPLIKKVADST